MASPKNILQMADSTAEALLGKPSPELSYWDVEMSNSLGNSCYVPVFARSQARAEQLAGERFPELVVTGLTYMRGE